MPRSITYALKGLKLIKDEDVARLSPLGDKHINVQGRYHLTITEAVLKGELRPLRDPDETEEFQNS